MKLIKIPRNIFQTWKTKEMSTDFENLTLTWRYNNPNYAYFLYDNNDCEEFIKKHFEPKVYKAYCRIIPGAFKADLWRYCILYIYGGVYIDIDTICLGNIDSLLDEYIEFMTPIDLNNCPRIGTYNLFNAFIASIPKHPILLDCINRIIFNVENNIIPFSNLDLTGPGVLGKSTNTFLNLSEDASFIGKEGSYNNNTICLLHFHQGSEYVSKNDNILFQNKNGNNDIKNIYNDESSRFGNIDWGNCIIPIKPIEPVESIEEFVTDNSNLPTIVTMIYNIRDKENNNTECSLNHKINKYLDLAKQFILKLPYPIIIFTDDDSIIQDIQNERVSLKDKTCIYKKPFEETYFYQYLDKLNELQSNYYIINGNIQHETPMYIILNNNKFDFMENAIDLNPFGSSHFIWMDFGINHVALDTHKIHSWIDKVPDKIKQLCINPYIEDIPPKIYFQYIYHNMAGGLFSGSIENIKKYIGLFKEKTQQIYDEGWYQIDEAVMTMVYRETPELFDVFYGDYHGIISNYFSPIYNIDLILTSSSKCINNNKLQEAYRILCYSLPFFESRQTDNNIFSYMKQHTILNYYKQDNSILTRLINLNLDSCQKFIDSNNINSAYELMNHFLNIFTENPSHNQIFWYIYQHIIVDYYCNSKCLRNEIVEVINILKIIQPEKTQNLLNGNIHNINCYENKDEIL